MAVEERARYLAGVLYHKIEFEDFLEVLRFVHRGATQVLQIELEALALQHDPLSLEDLD